MIIDLSGKAVRRRLEKKVYAFNAESANFVPDNNYNLLFFKMQQNYFNDMLGLRGYVFLNEVLLNLNIAPTKIGQVAGWRKELSGFIEIKVEQTKYPGTTVTEYSLRIEHDGFILLDVLGD